MRQNCARIVAPNRAVVQSAPRKENARRTTDGRVTPDLTAGFLGSERPLARLLQLQTRQEIEGTLREFFELER